mmetsp:Transcript_920/g.1939  ORF Transcript_920/g.1939 Transcript_920/m.1939 type:complete len:208 (-) Transcript_920:105-728(-)
MAIAGRSNQFSTTTAQMFQAKGVGHASSSFQCTHQKTSHPPPERWNPCRISLSATTTQNLPKFQRERAAATCREHRSFPSSTRIAKRTRGTVSIHHRHRCQSHCHQHHHHHHQCQLLLCQLRSETLLIVRSILSPSHHTRQIRCQNFPERHLAGKKNCRTSTPSSSRAFSPHASSCTPSRPFSGCAAAASSPSVSRWSSKQRGNTRT